MPRPQRILMIVACALLAVAAAACGGSSSGTTTSTTAKAVTTTTAKAITTPTVIVNGKSVQVPTDGQSPTITPYADSGQQIVLTSSGALPRTLYSDLNQAVIFTNLTSKTLTLTVRNVGKPPTVSISPGGTYSYSPTTLGFSYRASNGAAGIVFVGAFGH